MTKTRRLMAIAVLACAAAALAGCGGSGKSDSASTNASTGSETTVAAGPQTLKVSLTDEGCSPANLEAKTGSVTFEVSNAGTAKVTELELLNEEGIILGERENIIQGIDGAFTLNLQPGTYVLSCPNGSGVDGKVVVTGKALAGSSVQDPLLSQATALYSSYVTKETDRLLRDTKGFVAALRAGDVKRAKALFGPVRYHYETIEPVAEAFGDLDPAIDARENDVADLAKWTGFHRIEKILWLQNTTKGTEQYATKLLADIETLDRRARTLDFQPAQLANGAVELLDEVANSKITGEEDRYSHTDLSDFQGNLTGAQVAFQLLRPALVKQGDGDLAQRIQARFADVQHALDVYQRNTPLGFAYYQELTPADRRKMAAALDALAEPMSTVAAKVSG